jgi:hypothetical protein
MSNAILLFIFLFFGLFNFANAGFVDVPSQQLQGYLDKNTKVVVLFDSSDPKCTACEPADGGPFKSLSNDYGTSIQFVRVRWPSPWWQFPPALSAFFKQANIMGIPAVVGIENSQPVFVAAGRMENTDNVRKKIASAMGAVSTRQK